MLPTYTDTNVVRFPRELRSFDLDALITVEPDIMQADLLSERYGLDILPFDLIDVAETEARERIAALNAADAAAFQATLRRMSEQAFARAIELCIHAKKVDARARRLRRQADAAKPAEFGFLNVCAEDAERTAAIATLAALTEAHRARGIDAAVSLKAQGCDHFFQFGLVSVSLKGSASIRVIRFDSYGDHSRAEQIDARTAVHRPFQRLQSVDLNAATL